MAAASTDKRRAQSATGVVVVEKEKTGLRMDGYPYMKAAPIKQNRQKFF